MDIIYRAEFGVKLILAPEITENIEKKKFEILSTKFEAISKLKWSKEQNESESRIARIPTD